RSLIDVDAGYWTASNHVTHAEHTSRLRELIARFAHEIEVVRCDAISQSCGATLEKIELDSLPPAAPGARRGVDCDNRPVLHFPGAPANHSRNATAKGVVLESDEAEAIYGLMWSSLYVQGTQG